METGKIRFLTLNAYFYSLLSKSEINSLRSLVLFMVLPVAISLKFITHRKIESC